MKAARVNQTLGFEERRNPDYSGENLSEQSRESTTNSTEATYGVECENRTQTTLVGIEFSPHYIIHSPGTVHISVILISAQFHHEIVCRISRKFVLLLRKVSPEP